MYHFSVFSRFTTIAKDMQWLHRYSKLHDLTFNAKKSMCMHFSTCMNKHCGCSVIYLGNSICEFVKEVKYLGIMIHSSMRTTIDVSRQTRKFYLQANFLLPNIRHCSDQVKCVIFQTYCTSLYCCQLWFNSTKSSLKKLSTRYNSDVQRRLLGICKRIVLVKGLFPGVFQHLLNCFANLFIGLHNELSTVQIVLLVPHYRL